VGGTKDIKVSVRIISATNQDLAQMVKEGGFREDLYYRLKVVPIQVPPLRERREDIPLLAKHFMYHFSKVFNKSFQELAPDATALLLSYHWPGNIRELKNLFERTVLLESGTKIEARHLHLGPARARRSDESIVARLETVLASPVLPELGIEYEGLLGDIERALIEKASYATNWNQSRTAEPLHLKRDKLRYRMKLHGIHRRNMLREVA
jgi:DNA-binding NtrC family response regulator